MFKAFLSQGKGKRTQPEVLMVLLLLLGAIVALNIMAFILYRRIDFLTKDAAFLFIIWSVALLTVLSTVISGLLLRMSNRSHEVSLQLQYMEARNRQDQEMELMMERLRHLRHDLKSHLGTMHGLCDTKQYEVLEEYLKGLLGNVELSSEIVLLPDNRTLSIILTNKRALAMEKKIRLDYKVAGKQMPLTDVEQSSLFGNILDNAIEACEDLEAERRWIALEIKENEYGWQITCQNPYEGTPVVVNENWLSSKLATDEHGIGTRVMKGIIKDHEGALDYHLKDNIFTVAIFIQKKDYKK